MKKQLILATVSTILLITGCADNGRRVNGSNNPFASLFGSLNSNSETSSSNGGMSASLDLSSLPVYEKIDIDLTKLGSTMVYSQVYNMMNSPSEYIGKIVKVSGPFLPFDSNYPNYCYPAIYIADATACCANGLEFLLYGVPRCTKEGGNGYPLRNEEATIVGRFNTYLEDGSRYVHLEDSIWLKD